MALGRGGIRTGPQFRSLSPAKQARFERHLEASELLLKKETSNVGGALKMVFGKPPRGSDYQDFYDLAGRTRQDWQRLYRGDVSPPVITPEGVFDLAPGATWKQRSIAGKGWSLVANERRMSDDELARALSKLDREVRVIDEDGRIVRMRTETDVGRFRSFARSDEAKAERVISPRIGRWR